MCPQNPIQTIKAPGQPRQNPLLVTPSKHSVSDAQLQVTTPASSRRSDVVGTLRPDEAGQKKRKGRQEKAFTGRWGWPGVSRREG